MAVIVSAFAGPALAEPVGPDPMASIYACAQISGGAERLACFDREVAMVKGKQAAGAFTALDAQTVETLQKESFGFSLPSLPRLKLPGGSQAAAPAQTMTIAALRGGDGAPRLFLMTNGQIWRQIDGDANRRIRPGAEVTIERAALGSFLLTPKAGGLGLRVRREQ